MSLKKGAEGEDVLELQQELKQLGFDLDADGVFGNQTHNAVIALQTIFGSKVDGVVSSTTRELIQEQVMYGWNLIAAREAVSEEKEDEEEEEEEE
jgi:peptidoglycan hydrolase-like protein with peptidoglycan-binding domain